MRKRFSTRTANKSLQQRQRHRRLQSPSREQTASLASGAVTQQPNSTLTLDFQIGSNDPQHLSKLAQSSLTLSLFRYPRNRQHVSLQAWDAADEYLLSHFACEHLAANQPESDPTPALDAVERVLIINDEFGALACAVSKLVPTAEISWQSDSVIGRSALWQNAKLNGLPCTPDKIANVAVYTSLEPLPYSHIQPSIVLLKVPRTNAMLIAQLIQLQHLDSGTPIVAAGKAKLLGMSVLKLFRQYLDNVTSSLAVKKSRLIFATPKPAESPKLPSPYPTVWQTDNPPLTLFNHANVFSREQLDIGARLLLEHLPNANGKTVIDLGCGNGVLGLSLLQQYTPLHVYFVDESYMAVASAELGVQHNQPQQLSRCTFTSSDCLQSLPNVKADIVICNPPFHQHNTLTQHLAWQMLQEAKQALQVGGEIRIVANRHLGHHIKLKRLFGGYQVLASNNKFSILSAIKK